MKTVTIYTDGACSGNPGPGGWGAILKYGPYEKELSGGEAQTTNNRMELLGVIRALEALKEPCAVELWSDSKYVIDALSLGWAEGWRRRGWVKPDKKPALNPDLWERLLDLCAQHEMRYHWVRGHAENEYNNRCDAKLVLSDAPLRMTGFREPAPQGRLAPPLGELSPQATERAIQILPLWASPWGEAVSRRLTDEGKSISTAFGFPLGGKLSAGG